MGLFEETRLCLEKPKMQNNFFSFLRIPTFGEEGWRGGKPVETKSQLLPKICSECFPYVAEKKIVSTSPGDIFGQILTHTDTFNTPKIDDNGPKGGRKCTVDLGTTYLCPKLKNNWSQKTSLAFHVQRPVQRYGRLKLKFLCERFLFIAFVQMN